MVENLSRLCGWHSIDIIHVRHLAQLEIHKYRAIVALSFPRALKYDREILMLYTLEHDLYCETDKTDSYYTNYTLTS